MSNHHINTIMKKFLITLFGCAAMMLCLEGCSSQFDNPSVYTIASAMGAYKDPTLTSHDGFRAFNIVKAENSDKWLCVESILKFDYELGYEYIVEGSLLTEKEQDIADAICILTVHKVLSKELKDSDLPAEDWQWSIDKYYEYFGTQE